jgi:hypothetical protein
MLPMAVRYPLAYLRLALLKPSKGYKCHLTTHQRYADSNGEVIYAPFLSPDEHAELLALVDFTQKRTVEKLEAQTALSRLRAALPGLLAES